MRVRGAVLPLAVAAPAHRPDDRQPRRDGEHVNSRGMQARGWLTTVLIFAAVAGLVITWLK